MARRLGVDPGTLALILCRLIAVVATKNISSIRDPSPQEGEGITHLMQVSNTLDFSQDPFLS